MSTPNTKLLPSQKSDLRAFKAGMPKNMAFGQFGRMTVLVAVQANCLLVSTAVAAPDEKKLRAKVGEWYAMAHMQDRQYAALPSGGYDGCSPEEIALLIAKNLA